MALTDSTTFGALLKRLRLAAGLTQEALVLFRALGDTGQIAERLWSLGIAALHRRD